MTEQASLARRDAQVCARLEEAMGLTPADVRKIPLFSEDVHALEGLQRMASHLFQQARDV